MVGLQMQVDLNPIFCEIGSVQSSNGSVTLDMQYTWLRAVVNACSLADTVQVEVRCLILDSFLYVDRIIVIFGIQEYQFMVAQSGGFLLSLRTPYFSRFHRKN